LRRPHPNAILLRPELLCCCAAHKLRLLLWNAHFYLRRAQRGFAPFTGAAPVSEAIADARFATGDRVICAEWFGDSSPPATRWFGKRLSSELPRSEYEYIVQSLNRLVEAGPAREQGFAPVATLSGNHLTALTDDDLLHMALGVET
jgi:hypothetical protein